MLPSNPFGAGQAAVPLVAQIMPPLLGVFAVSLGVLVIRARALGLTLGRDVLFVRWRTWVIIAVVYLAGVLGGPLATTILASAIGCLAGMEAAALFGLPPFARPWLVAAAVAAPIAVLLTGPGAVPGIITVLVLAATLVGISYASMPTMVGLALGVLYPVAPLSVLVALEMDPRGGPVLVIAIALAVGLSDVGAFVFGRCFGRRPLAPRVSPAKTWAGVIGNLAGASLGMWLVASLLPATIPVAVLACTIGLGAVWGDLVESVLKRGRGVKDAGAVLPGFGGVLDRIDSLLVVVPLVALVIGARP